MVKKQEIEKKFIEFMENAGKVNGFDDLTCRILSNLYIEPEPIPLEELSQKTGYSLSAVSTSIRFMENIGFIQRSRKPKSKKVYFYMEKNILEKSLEIMRKKYLKIVLVAKEQIPTIIEEYKKTKNYDPIKLRIFENYYRQILFFDKAWKEFFDYFEKNAK